MTFALLVAFWSAYLFTIWADWLVQGERQTDPIVETRFTTEEGYRALLLTNVDEYGHYDRNATTIRLDIPYHSPRRR